MNEHELRSIVRDAIARHAAESGVVRAANSPAVPFAVVTRQHASHALFAVPSGSDTGGACVIEPAVACDHCGYCKSYGH